MTSTGRPSSVVRGAALFRIEEGQFSQGQANHSGVAEVRAGKGQFCTRGRAGSTEESLARWGFYGGKGQLCAHRRTF